MHIFHDWKLIAVSSHEGPCVDHGTYGRPAIVLVGTTRAWTVLLWRCACGKFKDTSVSGKFTLEQIKQVQP